MLAIVADLGGDAGGQVGQNDAANLLKPALARGKSHQLQLALATTAQKHKAKLKDEKKQEEPEAKKLPAIKQQEHSTEVIKSTASGQQSDHGGQGKVTAYSEAQLQLSSPAGMAITTPKDAILSAGNTSNLTASQDLNFAAQGNFHHAVKAGISLFTYGKLRKDAKEEPNTETGIKLHAGTGKVSTQSQSDKTSITADKTITVASINKEIMIAAPKHVLLTAMGAYLKLEGGNIMIHGPGTMAFNASMKELAGPASSSPVFPQFPIGKMEPNQLIIERFYHDKEPLAGAPYEAVFTDGSTRKGFLDGNGRATLLDIPPGTASVRFGAMPGEFKRKDLTATPEHKAKPAASDIDALIDKYAAQVKKA